MKVISFPLPKEDASLYVKFKDFFHKYDFNQEKRLQYDPFFNKFLKNCDLVSNKLTFSGSWPMISKTVQECDNAMQWIANQGNFTIVVKSTNGFYTRTFNPKKEISNV